MSAKEAAEVDPVRAAGGSIKEAAEFNPGRDDTGPVKAEQ